MADEQDLIVQLRNELVEPDLPFSILCIFLTRHPGSYDLKIRAESLSQIPLPHIGIDSQVLYIQLFSLKGLYIFFIGIEDIAAMYDYYLFFHKSNIA